MFGNLIISMQIFYAFLLLFIINVKERILSHFQGRVLLGLLNEFLNRVSLLLLQLIQRLII